jgi:phage protein D
MPTINPLPAKNALRLPRGIVKVNGTMLPGWIEWEVNNNTHRQADTFRVMYACGQLPTANNAAWLTAQTKISVQIYAGFPKNPAQFGISELTLWMQGNCDGQSYDPAQNTIELNGRDLTSELIDTKTSEQFLNQQASQIAATIAARHGFAADVDATGTQDGTFYEIDHARLNDASSEWDLLTELADNEGYNVWMTGSTLHFKVQDAASSGTYGIVWTPRPKGGGVPQANLTTLKFNRNNMISQKNTQVTVRSWNAKQKVKFTGTATANRPNSVGTLAYIYNEPGLNQDQANTRAKEKLKGIVRNEMCLSGELPGDNILTVRNLVNVSGTGTAYDQTYWPVSVSRRMDMGGGYKMSLEAKNHSPETERDS